jgi:hypothetical protein
MLGAVPARGQAPRMLADEVREYEVLIKGKAAGKTFIHISDNDDGTTVAATDTNVKIESWLFTYKHEYHGREVWRGDQMLRADGHAIDDGKKLAVHATVSERGSVIEWPGKKQQPAPKLAMTTNYWRLPDMPPGTNNLSFMDSDTGGIETGWLKRVGPEQITVGGQPMACTHYRVVGTAKAELWFDRRARLMRQQSVEDGYPTELRLTRIHDNSDTALRR